MDLTFIQLGATAAFGFLCLIFLIEALVHRAAVPNRRTGYALIILPLVLLDAASTLLTTGFSWGTLLAVGLSIPLGAALLSTVLSTGLYYARKVRMPAILKRKALLPGLGAGLLGAAIAMLYSQILLYFTNASIHPSMDVILLEHQVLLGSGIIFFLTVCIAVVRAAIFEELFFRFALQNWLAGGSKLLTNQYWISILLSTLLWTFLHSGMLIPDWVKFAQILPMGFGFAYLYGRFGLISSVTSHVAFNIACVALFAAGLG